VKTNKSYRNIFLIGAFFLLANAVYFSGCSSPLPPEEIFQNPVDTASTIFILPRTSILAGPQNGQTITNDSITIRWQGNTDAVLFSYKVDTDAWSAWSSATSTVLDYLDEGSHTLIVKAQHRNKTTEETNPSSVTFIVDAVKGPSAMFYPRRIFVNAGAAFTYNVYAEEVNLLYGARMAIHYDPALVTIDTIQAGALMQGNGSSALLIPTIDNSTGIAFVDVATVGHKPKGVSGSGTLAILRCHALTAGSVDFTFSKTDCSYRDTTNASITIRDLIAGKVVVK